MKAIGISLLLFWGSFGELNLFGADAKPASPASLSDRLDAQLPSWLVLGGEERVRTEYIVGEGFKPVDDAYLLNRLRLNVEIRPEKWMRFVFQGEDARVFGQNTLPAPASQKETMDLRLGYMQAGIEEGPAMLRVGRQPLNFGEGRLLSDPNWSNVGRSFDAARLTLHRGGAQVDLFTGASAKVDPLNFDLPTPGEHFDGAYGSLKGLVTDATIEPYMFWRLEHGYKNEAGKLGNLSEKTLGFRWAGKLPARFDYGAETAGQFGSWAGDGIRAWMGHWVVGRTLSAGPRGPRLFVEYNRGSGDSNPHNGVHGTFDTLFPGAHDKYGLTDLLCPSNFVHLRTGVQYTVYRGVVVSASYNDFSLASARDGLYLSGKSFVRSVDGTAGTHVGQEADFQAQWTPSRLTQLTLGYGRLFPGEFLDHMTTGVPYNILFLNLAQKF